ncbi:dehydrogenase [Sulfurifustis variabilis]|uniref:Dehydrogenase n=1 Tax=Sulfurifustis variabilis TaxID=1675686 RepID=A0A1B4V6S5_9GAMM|nr:NAD(P)H-dependent oxidoreductase [Sulfurifustis variabilis]BAU49218.1 dehydrogenase [Sulfurifustis variabilis]
MPRRILIIEGHPDPSGTRFGNALAAAYAAAAEDAGHEVARIVVARLDFPLLRTQKEFDAGEPPEPIRAAQESIRWADHLVLFYPLWHGDVPALLKGFLEQVFRPGFAAETQRGKLPRKGLTGKSARIVVTMGMPAFVYRWYFGAHGLKSLERNILRFSGVRPVRATLIGLVEGSPARRQHWLEQMRRLGRSAR